MHPYVITSSTSKAAADAIENIAGNLREECFNFIRSRGKTGATADEVEAALNLRHQTCSARVNELATSTKQIVKTDSTRLTRSRRKAAVYVASEFA